MKLKSCHHFLKYPERNKRNLLPKGNSKVT